MRNADRKAVLLAAALLAGCGKGPATPAAPVDTAQVADAPAAKAIDPCGLLTADEVGTLIGDRVTGVQHADADGCDYHSGQDDGVQLRVDATGGHHQMEIVRKSGQLLGGMGAAMAGKGRAGADVDAMLQPDKSSLPPLGDETVWELNDTLAVRKGDAFVEVSPPLARDPMTHPGNPLIPDAEKRAIAQAIAVKLLANLNR